MLVKNRLSVVHISSKACLEHISCHFESDQLSDFRPAIYPSGVSGTDTFQLIQTLRGDHKLASHSEGRNTSYDKKNVQLGFQIEYLR